LAETVHLSVPRLRENTTRPAVTANPKPSLPAMSHGASFIMIGFASIFLPTDPG